MNQFFTELYQHFNDRDIDWVIERMTDDVQWANGMEGGYVYGHAAVKEYWTRQFQLISSKVTPISLEVTDSDVKIKVQQVVHDLQGILLADEWVYHHFQLRNNKVAIFRIGEKVKIV